MVKKSPLKGAPEPQVARAAVTRASSPSIILSNYLHPPGGTCQIAVFPLLSAHRSDFLSVTAFTCNSASQVMSLSELQNQGVYYAHKRKLQA